MVPAVPDHQEDMMEPGATLAKHGDLTVRVCDGGAALARGRGKGLVLSPEEWRWLFMYGACEASRLLNPPPDLRAMPASPTPAPAQPTDDAQASLLEDQ